MNREKAIITPETAENRINTLRDLDFQVGDYVQILNIKGYVGRVGQIIGISSIRRKRGGLAIRYRLKLSDKEGIDARACNINFIRRGEE